VARIGIQETESETPLPRKNASMLKCGHRTDSIDSGFGFLCLTWFRSSA
jgi:hypothetical protein